MDRNYLKGRLGDRINAVLAAAGYNFGLLLRWLAELLRAIRTFVEAVPVQTSLEPGTAPVLHARLRHLGNAVERFLSNRFYRRHNARSMPIGDVDFAEVVCDAPPSRSLRGEQSVRAVLGYNFRCS
jgi:hypothetical protein